MHLKRFVIDVGVLYHYLNSDHTWPHVKILKGEYTRKLREYIKFRISVRRSVYNCLVVFGTVANYVGRLLISNQDAALIAITIVTGVLPSFLRLRRP